MSYLGCLLQGHDGVGLEAKVGLEVLCIHNKQNNVSFCEPLPSKLLNHNYGLHRKAQSRDA
jgi:hypothetical protein